MRIIGQFVEISKDIQGYIYLYRVTSKIQWDPVPSIILINEPTLTVSDHSHHPCQILV